jgi:cytochrome P450
VTDAVSGKDLGTCPVVDTDYRLDRPAFWHYANLNELREAGPAFWNTVNGGFWMVTRYAEIREALQNNAVFTNDVLNPLSQREDHMLLLPQHLNPPEHVKYRHILNPWFSPAAVDRITPLARSRCAALIDELAGTGSCDFVSDFGIVYPTEMFLAFIGLPVEDGKLFLPWVEAIFSGFFGGDPHAAGAAVRGAITYFEEVTADREQRPRDPTTDLVTHLLQSTVDDQPLPRDQVTTICVTLMLAGLDTTRSQLGYIYHHLATHDDDRRLLIERPELIPSAVEEFIRLYSLILTSGRYVAEDIDFHGCPMKKGDAVWLGLTSANRDPRVFPDPDRFVPDRQPNPHLAFAAGAHRCLGAHLARKELVVALEEWHARIPDYRLAGDEPLMERGGQLTLLTLPLTWTP